MQKLRIVWICHFSNEKIRSKLTFSTNWVENLLRVISNKPKSPQSDFANWVSRGIEGFEKLDNIELHIVAPHYGMKHKTEKFVTNGVNYWFFRPEDDSLLKKGLKLLIKNEVSSYRGNRKVVKKIIEHIKPAIVHVYGAENPYYSIAALDVDTKKHPLLISLQTLLSHPQFKSKTNINESSYKFRAGVEKLILTSASFIGSSNKGSREHIWKHINPNVLFTKTFLGIPEGTYHGDQEKVFDFVYFAASIDKAADFAIEAFALVRKTKPYTSLNIVGGAPTTFKKQLVKRIDQLGISDNVTFSGRLITQEDVFKQINMSRFALLPLKVDSISSTIREAMFAKLPVISTITSGTPSLNDKRESILISEQGDHKAMANNMLKLLESEEYAKIIQHNALQTAKERWSNSRNMSELVQAYKAIIDHHKNGTPIPAEIATINPKLNYAH